MTSAAILDSSVSIKKNSKFPNHYNIIYLGNAKQYSTISEELYTWNGTSQPILCTH